MVNSLPKIHKSQVPAKLEDIRKFILVGREVLRAHQAKLRAIQKVGEAYAAQEAALSDAQDLSEALITAEAKLGEMLGQIERKYVGSPKRTDNAQIRSLPEGIDKRMSHKAQTIANNPEVVERVMAQARDEKRIATPEEVYRAIKAPHVSFNAGDNEWYTPPEIASAARMVLGEIDCDPASSKKANEIIGAKKIWTVDDDGLQKKWGAVVWMNPPYAQPLCENFCQSLLDRIDAEEVRVACVLVNNATETVWFQGMLAKSVAVCFPRGRVRFLDKNGNPGAPLQGQALILFGGNVDRFKKAFAGVGQVLCRI